MAGDRAPEQHVSFWQNALVYLGGTVAVQGVSFVSQPVFGYLMTPDEYGVVASYVFWMTATGLVISLQLQSTLNVARSTWGASSFAGYVAGLVPVYALTGGAVLGLLLVAPDWWSARLSLPVGHLFAAVVNGIFFALGLLATSHAVTLGHRVRYLWLSAGTVLGPVALGLALVLALPDAVEARIIGYAASSGLVLLALAVRTPRRPVRPRNLGPALAIALPLLVHELLSLVTNQSNRIFLLEDAGAAAAGVFAFAFGLGSITTVAAVAVNSAWTPWFFERSDAGDDDTVRANASQLVWMFSLGAGSLCLVSPDLLRLVSRPAFWDGALVMAVFVAIGHLGLVFNLAANHIVRRRRTGWVLAISLVACTVNVSLNLALIPRWSIGGAALASLAAYLCLSFGAVLIVRVVFASRSLPWGQMLSSSVITVLFLTATYVLDEHSVARWLGAAAVLGLLGWIGLGKVREHRRSSVTDGKQLS